MNERPKRKALPHAVPDWVPDGETYFITINCRPRGENQLARQTQFVAIRSSVKNYTERALWHVQLMVIMPDHLHSLMTLNTRSKSISAIIGGWKRYLAKTEGIVWQKNYFEHRIRSQNELFEKESYLRQNPVRADLCKNAAEWPFIIRSDR
ncbi:MAG: hypothetical protein H8E75_04370 [Puniceicoccaceae bacterium]|jgi:putative transposase|nr:hypothetical protein [Puniceicoccaceae bacterium]